jgi:hypothetical protein
VNPDILLAFLDLFAATILLIGMLPVKKPLFIKGWFGTADAEQDVLLGGVAFFLRTKVDLKVVWINEKF